MARSSVRKIKAPHLLPWGLMNEVFESEVAARPIPRDWKPLDGSLDLQTAFRVWKGRVARQIGYTLWPAYRRDKYLWGTPAVGRLLDADFRLLHQLHPLLQQPIEGAFPTTVTQADYFSQEDDVTIEIGTGYERYDPLLPGNLRSELLGVIKDGIVDKSGNLDLLFKQIFQRPRPYQVAFLQKRSKFSYREAKSANTPSLVCGHCLEGAMGGCNAYVKLRSRMSKTSIRVLRQFSVDIGDRRVLAGIHYPSDNLSSWITALNLVPHVFDAATAPDVKIFLWEAISAHSLVYAAIRANAQSSKNSPYRKAIQLLEALALP
jgi:hypothetical protein